MILYFARRLKLKKLARELRTAIAAESVMFSRDIKDQHYDKLNQAALTLGALGFFLHVLNRVSVRRNSDALREAAFVPIAFWLVRFFAKVSRKLDSGSAKTTKGEALNYVNLRCSEYSKAPSVLGSGAEDTTSALWLAASAIAADVGHQNQSQAMLVMFIQERLLEGIMKLKLPQRLEAIEPLLGPPLGWGLMASLRA
jgi:hypothetical protein